MYVAVYATQDQQNTFVSIIITFPVRNWTSSIMIAMREIILEARTCAKLALRHDTLRISDNNTDHRLNTEQISLLQRQK